MNNPKVNVVVSGHRNEYHSTYKTYILRGGIPFADQVTMPDTKYVIKYNFDLGGGAFDLNFSNADTHTVAEVTYYYIPFIADGSKYTLIDDTLVFVDAEWNGLSAREIKPEKGTLFMIASITGGLHKNGYGINVVTVPENCILEFDGGSLDNGVIVGQDTVFINVGDVDIWGENLTREGTWREHSGGSSIDIDDALSDTSENPVQNKVVEAVLDTERRRAVAAEESLSRTKADKANSLAGYGINDAYTKEQTEGKITAGVKSEEDRAKEAEESLEYSKANKASTLAGYGITDTYTKETVDYKIEIEHNRASQKEEELRTLYEALTQTDYILGPLPSTGLARRIYRVPGDNSYSDYMYANDGDSIPVLMATYNNAIDTEPTLESRNLAESGGIARLYGHNENNSEYIRVLTDGNNKLLIGIKKNADVYFGAGVPQQIRNYIRESVTEVTKWLNDVFSIVDSKEDRVGILLDKDGRIVSYRKKEGTLVEPAGIETKKAIIDNLELGKNAVEYIADNISNEGDILVLHPKPVMQPILATFKCFSGSRSNINHINFNLLWFSDLHSVWRRLTRISKFNNEYKDYIDDVVCTGDAFHTYNDSASSWTNYAASFLNIIGNHECFGPQRTVGSKTIPGWISPGYSQKECYDKYFKPYLDNTNIVIQENKCYFYKDYPNYKIRIIAIDNYHWKENIQYTDGTPIERYPDGTAVDHGEQLEWLNSTLTNARQNNYSVICMTHDPVIPSELTAENTPFHRIDWYNSGNTAPGTGLNSEIVEAVQSYIDEGGKFITWLTGHTHDDRFGVVKNHPDQLMITLGTSGNLIQPGSQWESPSFYDRTENTVNDDMFNIVSINVWAGVISMYRVGCNYDKAGRHIDSIGYDYKNKRII